MSHGRRQRRRGGFNQEVAAARAVSPGMYCMYNMVHTVISFYVETGSFSNVQIAGIF